MGDTDQRDVERARLIAFYLPQFHPIEVNDRFHGPGFTEWTHVSRATPLYRGHQQPVLPGELGYYDLRLPEVRHAQATLARTYGIDALCYWHYWSDGERMMERPFSEVLADGEPDLPFCLGWANHSWLDVNRPGEVLFDQAYPGRDDEARHFAAIEAALHDPRYVRVDGKPLVYVFRPLEVPDLAAFTEHWRELAQASGLDGLWFVGQDRNSTTAEQAVLRPAVDGMVKVATASSSRRPLTWRIADKLRGGPRRFSYEAMTHQPPALLDWAPESYPSVLTNWDNTPRWGRQGTVVVDPDPRHLQTMVGQALDLVADRPADHQLVFVKSWNEWAEGNHLEPCARYGRGRLEAVRAARDAAGR